MKSGERKSEIMKTTARRVMSLFMVLEGLRDIGPLPLRLEVEHLTDEAQSVLAAFFGAMKSSTSSLKSRSPTLSLLLMALKARIAATSAASSRLLVLDAAEISRRAGVHDEHDSELTLLGVFLHVGRAHARSDVPVDASGSRRRDCVLTHFFEVHSRGP